MSNSVWLSKWLIGVGLLIIIVTVGLLLGVYAALLVVGPLCVAAGIMLANIPQVNSHE